MKYKSKKKVLQWVKTGMALSGLLMLITPHDLIARLSGVVVVLLFFTHLWIRHLMKKHFQKELKKDELEEPEWMFEWLTIGWTGTLFIIAIPGMLYVHDFISLDTYGRINAGGFGFLGLYFLLSGVRLIYRRSQLKKKNADRMNLGKKINKS
ncbi:MAG: hypothetical protein JNM39_17925 [Bdellovibrionaceae bacterium]|nr:hypothetical protein [Pseudobdellovibrionaceae bacterium]